MRAFRYSPGTRVRVRRGPFPVDPALVGRVGTVFRTDDYRPGEYDVILDGETELRTFSEEELEPAVVAAAAGGDGGEP